MGVLTQLLCLLLACLPGEEGSAGDIPEMGGCSSPPDCGISPGLCGSLTRGLPFPRRPRCSQVRGPGPPESSGRKVEWDLVDNGDFVFRFLPSR